MGRAPPRSAGRVEPRRSWTIAGIVALAAPATAQTEQVHGPDNSLAVNSAIAFWRQQQQPVGEVYLVTDVTFSCGSGFLVDDEHLLTCAHVVDEASGPEQLEVRFGYVDGRAPFTNHRGCGGPQDPVHPECVLDLDTWQVEAIHIISPELGGLDIAVLTIADMNGVEVGEIYGHAEVWLRRPVVGESVHMLHHPDGACMECSSDNAAVVTSLLADGYFGHKADTLQGSSGSPVFADDRGVLGMHCVGGDPNKAVDIRTVRKEIGRYQCANGVDLGVDFDAHETPAEYIVVDLEAPSRALGTNDNGQVVTAAGHLYNGCRIVALPPGGRAVKATARGINDKGTAVGFSGPANGDREATLWKQLADGSWQATALGHLDGGTTSEAAMINNAVDLAVGFSTTDNGQLNKRAVFWFQGNPGPIAIPTLGGSRNEATAVNDLVNVQIVGWSAAGGLERHAFVYQNSTVTDLGALPDQFPGSAALDVNNGGVVVGWSSTGIFPHAVMWRKNDEGDWEITDLGTLDQEYSEARAINDAGVIVGFSADFAGGARAFVYTEESGMRDLNALIPEGTGWVLRDAYDVDDRGRIVGVGRLGTGSPHAVLLVPKPAAAPPGVAGPEPDCLDADLDLDCGVGILDFLGLLAAWGPCANCVEDLDLDGVVGVADLTLLLGVWGECPAAH